jgi:cell division protein FtsW (lipid II flippase)
VSRGVAKVVAAGVLPALLAGAGVMVAHGVPASRWLVNPVAAAAGILVLLLLGTRLKVLLLAHPLAAAFAALALPLGTFVAPGVQGVHRWLSLGPVHLHPGALADPLLLLAAAVLLHRRQAVAAAAFLATGLAVHVVQPDAGQATALAAGAATLAMTTAGLKLAERLLLLTAAAGGAVLAWLRPDPLPPVDGMENIVALAFESHVLLGALAIATLAVLPAAALLSGSLGAGRWSRPGAPDVAFAAYLLASVLAVALGEFPIPVLGFGASPVLGAVLGLGLLASIGRALRTAPPPSNP